MLNNVPLMMIRGEKWDKLENVYRCPLSLSNCDVSIHTLHLLTSYSLNIFVGNEHTHSYILLGNGHTRILLGCYNAIIIGHFDKFKKFVCFR